MRAPRYETRSLAQVLPSVASALGDPDAANALQLPQLSQAVVIVVDGIGFEQLREAQDFVEHLRVAGSEPIDSAFPSTTPAGLATLTLAMPPGLHGFVGATFELPDFECVLNPLHWEADPAPEAVQPEPNMFARMQGIAVRSHGPAAYAASGMTRTLLGGATPRPYEQFDPKSVLAEDGALDYVYLPQLDKVGHVEGALTPAWFKTLREIDRIVGQLRERVPATGGLFITGDHGMVTVPDGNRIYVDDVQFQSGVRLMCGEPRMRHLYTNTPVDVSERWQALLGERAVVLTREAALEMGLFGAWDECLSDRIGDVIAIAQDQWAFTSRVVDPKVSGLRGLHGGLTNAELLVPGLLLTGVA